MGKAFAILLIVLGIWMGLEIYTKGSDQAFGGALAWLSGDQTMSEGTEPGRTPAQRIGDRVRANVQQGVARSAGQTEDGDLDEGDVMNGDVDDIEE